MLNWNEIKFKVIKMLIAKKIIKSVYQVQKKFFINFKLFIYNTSTRFPIKTITSFVSYSENTFVTIKGFIL